MLELKSKFRYNNKRALGGIRNFTAILGESISQRHSRLARLMAENPTILDMEMEVRLFLESYTWAKAARTAGGGRAGNGRTYDML